MTCFHIKTLQNKLNTYIRTRTRVYVPLLFWSWGSLFSAALFSYNVVNRPLLFWSCGTLFSAVLLFCVVVLRLHPYFFRTTWSIGLFCIVVGALIFHPSSAPISALNFFTQVLHQFLCNIMIILPFYANLLVTSTPLFIYFSQFCIKS